MPPAKKRNGNRTESKLADTIECYNWFDGRSQERFLHHGTHYRTISNEEFFDRDWKILKKLLKYNWWSGRLLNLNLAGLRRLIKGNILKMKKHKFRIIHPMDFEFVTTHPYQNFSKKLIDPKLGEILLVPFLHKKHWYLVVLKVDTNPFVGIFNSYNKVGWEISADFKERIDDAMKEILQTVNIRDDAVWRRYTSPQQKNGHDCALFVAYGIYMVIKNQIDFEAVDYTTLFGQREVDEYRISFIRYLEWIINPRCKIQRSTNCLICLHEIKTEPMVFYCLASKRTGNAHLACISGAICPCCNQTDSMLCMKNQRYLELESDYTGDFHYIERWEHVWVNLKLHVCNGTLPPSSINIILFGFRDVYWTLKKSLKEEDRNEDKFREEFFPLVVRRLKSIARETNNMDHHLCDVNKGCSNFLTNELATLLKPLAELGNRFAMKKTDERTIFDCIIHRSTEEPTITCSHIKPAAPEVQRWIQTKFRDPSTSTVTLDEIEWRIQQVKDFLSSNKKWSRKRKADAGESDTFLRKIRRISN